MSMYGDPILTTVQQYNSNTNANLRYGTWWGRIPFIRMVVTFFMAHWPGYLNRIRTVIHYGLPCNNTTATRKPTYGMVPDGAGFHLYAWFKCFLWLTDQGTSTELERLSIMDYRKDSAGSKFQQQLFSSSPSAFLDEVDIFGGDTFVFPRPPFFTNRTWI